MDWLCSKSRCQNVIIWKNLPTLQNVSFKRGGCDVRRSWPSMMENRGKVIFVLVDKYGKYGPMYRSMFPDLRNGTFFVSQPGHSPHPADLWTIKLPLL